MRQMITFLFIAIIAIASFAGKKSITKTASNKSEGKPEVQLDLKPLNEVTERYRQSKMVKSDLVKVVKAELTGKEITNEGIIAIAEGNFRIESRTPEKSILVFDGKEIWNEQGASSDFGGPAQVTRQIVSKKNRSQTLFATLLTKEPITKNFKIRDVVTKGEEVTYFADSLKADLNLKDFRIVIETRKRIVSEISFKDDIGNLTTMKFSNIQFKSTIEKNLFIYKPPKNAQVTKI